jgi:amino-acid N-acetyltransferase
MDAAGVSVALLTETAAVYFSQLGFTLVDRAELPSALEASMELRGACPRSAVRITPTPRSDMPCR